MKQLSNKQQLIYDYIVNFTSQHGYPPSIREICAAVALKSPSSVHSHLKTLIELGYIQKDDKKPRALSTAAGSNDRVPILGRVTAGNPILAFEEVEGYIPFESNGSNGNFFALRVQGDSMIDAGIMDGDYIIIRSQHTAHTGEIVVAMIEDEATVKRLLVENHKIWLMPENPDYSPIDGDGCAIVGVVKALWRKY